MITREKEEKPTPWQRSTWHPHVIFVPDTAVDTVTCNLCVFVRPRDNGCHAHACGGGLWLNEADAVSLRLEGQ